MTAAIDAARAQGRAALIGYLPVGYPSVDASCRAIAAMVEAGVDGVEVGVPYSDPSLDGPTVQEAAEAALVAGVRVRDVFAGVRAAVEAGAPAVVMSYYNPLLQYGLERFAEDLAAAGGAGVILPDLTPDNAAEWLEAAAKHGLETTFLVAPSSTQERIHYTVAATTGFLYATAVMGVTGSGQPSARKLSDWCAIAARLALPTYVLASASPRESTPRKWRLTRTASSSAPRLCEPSLTTKTRPTLLPRCALKLPNLSKG